MRLEGAVGAWVSAELEPAMATVCEQTVLGVLDRQSAYVPLVPTWSKQKLIVAEPEVAVILLVVDAVVK
ncbi:MAG: hypothetical protein A2723_01560 [Candidatus Zambryskibacteria bacterium RIFCSPHIGHO2_01_FULL_52_18]|nr:MAG: hypothetical protein A2723_01560 [Candidatus Zambryskibacteria bacterium RIFCSPHIGHO2_01_FULL_52_18]